MGVYALVDSETNICSNMICLETYSSWSCSEGVYMVEDNQRLGSIGQTYDNINKVWIPLPPPEPPKKKVPQSITRRQCSLQLLNESIITSSEALDMARSGIPPSAVMSYIQTLEAEEQIRAEIDFAAENYFRNNELLILLMTINGWSEEEIDDFFIAASKL